MALASAGSVTLTRPAFCANTAPVGAALASGLQDGDSTTQVSVRVDNGLFRTSEADSGGAVWVSGTSLTLQHSTFFANTSTQAPEMIQVEDGGSVELTRNLLLRGNDSQAPITGAAEAFASKENVWWPTLPLSLAGLNPVLSANAASNYRTDTNYCADPWVWPTLDSDIVNLSADGSSGSDLDGSAPDAGAAGGPLADPLIWSDSDNDGVAAPHDCAPEDGSVSPLVVEICDGADNDCDGLIDEDFTESWYPDGDADGYGSPASTSGCPIEGWVTNDLDCDDGDTARSPDAPEICDELDNNCDGKIDEGVSFDGYVDVDGDGFGSGELRTSCDSGGLAALNTDCNDSDSAVYPGAPEVCDGEDSDCSGVADDNALDRAPHYEDLDGDGIGGEFLGETCPAAGRVATGGDCDDSDPAIDDQNGTCERQVYRLISGGCSTSPGPGPAGLFLLLFLLRRQRGRERDSH